MDLAGALSRHGLVVVFGFAFASQAGAPIPAEPALILAGAQAASGTWAPHTVWIVATFAALLADHAWFFAGRLRGRSLLGIVCRISLSPDTCVRNADGLFHKLGGGLLVLAKLIPGVAAVAIPTAAASGMSYRRFIAYDGLGAALWSALWIGVGMIFGREVDRVLALLEQGSSRLPWIVAIAMLAIWIGAKALHRFRLRRLYDARRIDANEVARWLDDGTDFVIIDARSELSWRDDPRRLPRSERLEDLQNVDGIAVRYRDRTVISFCTCPNEVSAALVAERLMAAGHLDVRVLAGGEAALSALGR